MKDVFGYLLTAPDMRALRSLVGFMNPMVIPGHDFVRLEMMGLVDTGTGWTHHGRRKQGSRLTTMGKRVATECLKYRGMLVTA